MIDGTAANRQVLSFLDNEQIKNGELCKHIVVVLSYRASCDAFEKLLDDYKGGLRIFASILF